MGITIATTRVACDTSTGNQDITAACGDLTPKAALFVVTSATADATAANEAIFSFGACDDTREWCLYQQDEHAQGTSDSDTNRDVSNCVSIWTVGGGSTDGVAAFNSFITNGVRITWSNAPVAAYLMTVTFFCGTDLTAHADVEGLGGTVDADIDITAPGFTPDVLITALSYGEAGANMHGSMGVVDWSGVAVTQRALGWVFRGGQATTANATYCRNDAGLVLVNVAGALWSYIVFSDFDANGFTATPRNAQPLNYDCCYLALNVNSAVDHAVVTYSTPTSTGSDSDTGAGFTPQYVHLIENFCEAVNTTYNDNRGGTFGVADITATTQYANSVQSEDGQATSNTQSMSDDVAVRIEDDDGSAGLTATLTSLDANGWTFNYSAVEAAAKLFFVMAIEEEAAPAGGNPWYYYAQQ